MPSPPQSAQAYTVAIDLGGTRFRVAAVDHGGRIVARHSELTHAEEGRDSVLRRVLAAAERIIDRVGTERVAGIGIGVPGPVNPWVGLVLQTPNLPGWHEVPIKAILEAQLHQPVQVGNDANLAAVGEHVYGAGQGTDDLIYLTVSTGIGGGVLAGGRLLLGAAGLAAEPGHMTMLPDGPRCGCGNQGCLETLASGTAIAREARRRLADGLPSALSGLTPEEVDAETVVEAAYRGDPLARDVMARAAGYLGLGIANLVHLFNPRAIILGGGVANAGDLLFEPVRATVQARCMPGFRDVRITQAQLGDDVGLLGAAALAFQPSWQAR